jgi:hypothetical protein
MANGNGNQPAGIAYPPREPPQKETLKNQPVQMALVAGLAWWLIVTAVFAGLAIWGPRAQYWLGWFVAGMVLLRGISEIWQEEIELYAMLGYGVTGLALCVLWFFRGAVWTEAWLIAKGAALKLYVALNGLGVVLILLGLIVRAVVEMFDPSWPPTREAIPGEHGPLLPIVWLWGGMQRWFDWMPLPSGRYDDEEEVPDEEEKVPVVIPFWTANGAPGSRVRVDVAAGEVQWLRLARSLQRNPEVSLSEDSLARRCGFTQGPHGNARRFLSQLKSAGRVRTESGVPQATEALVDELTGGLLEQYV